MLLLEERNTYKDEVEEFIAAAKEINKQKYLAFYVLYKDTP